MKIEAGQTLFERFVLFVLKIVFSYFMSLSKKLLTIISFSNLLYTFVIDILMFISLILCRINTIFIAVYSVKTDKLPLILRGIGSP